MKKKIYIYSLLVFIVDLISKIIVSSFINNEIIIINNFFSLNFVKNTGGAFSIFSGYSFILAVFALVILYFIDKYFINDKLNKLSMLSFILLIGGIVGNLFDRVLHGYVIDFLSFKIFGYYFPIFNIADICICVGAFLFIIDMIRGDVNEHKSR